MKKRLRKFAQITIGARKLRPKQLNRLKGGEVVVTAKDDSGLE